MVFHYLIILKQVQKTPPNKVNVKKKLPNITKSKFLTYPIHKLSIDDENIYVTLCSKRAEGYDYYWISAETFNSNYICTSPIQCSWEFQPTEIAFDKFGNLYILANRWHYCVPNN